MKKIFILFLLPATILMGCSKTDESIIDVEKTCQVSKISSGEIEWTFEYDGTGKVTNAKEKWTGSHEYSFDFSYFNDRIEVKIVGGEDDVELIYKLNESGKITSSTKKSENEVGANYSYSPDGYMIKEVSAFGVLTTSLIYNEGNLIHRKTEYSSSSSHDIDERIYNYNASEGNFAFSSLVVDFFGEAFMDELHKHVLLEQGFFGKNPRMLPYQSSQNTFSYEKDSKGKILLVKDRSAYYEGGESFSTIHYQCK